MEDNNTTLRSRKTGLSGQQKEQEDGGVEKSSKTTLTHPQNTSEASQQPATTTALLFTFLPTLTLIFTGCCSNVYTLESLIQTSPASGNLITATQFVLTALLTLPNHLAVSSAFPYLVLRSRAIPLKKWIAYTAFFLTINILNNTAFSYRISVPLHIILRSAGPVATMAIGHLVGGRRYPPSKVAAVMLLFSGVVMAAISDTYSKTPAPSASSPHLSSSTTSPKAALLTQAPGFALLALALILSALMGLFSDDMYKTYGRTSDITSESLFYSHTLSLPYFLLQRDSLSRSLNTLTANSVSVSTYLAPSSSMPITPLKNPFHHHNNNILDSIPLSVPMLLANALTQYVCIRGVNALSARSSSLTVGIVLNIRKLVSLLLSIWLFGNKLGNGVIVGALIVFVGGGLYAVPSGPVTTTMTTTTRGSDGVRKADVNANANGGIGSRTNDEVNRTKGSGKRKDV